MVIARSLRQYWLLAFLFLGTTISSACSANLPAGLEVKWDPPVVPLSVVVDTFGEIHIETDRSKDWPTPIGVFSVSGISAPVYLQEPDDVIHTYLQERLDGVNHVLIIQINQEQCVYELNGREFEIDLEANDFRLKHISYTENNIYIQLEGNEGIGCAQKQMTVSKRAASQIATSCEGASPSHLNVGDAATISYLQVTVHVEPGESTPLVKNKYLAQGRTVQIIDGPICAERVLFWKVRSEEINFSGGSRGIIVGWVAEESGDIYMMRPR